MDTSNFDFDKYNKRFAEETKDYAKICNGKPCQCADECEMKVFCNIDEKKKELHYVIDPIPSSEYYSFKNKCKQSIPEGGYTRGHLEALYHMGKFAFPKIMPPSIDVWIEELREMGLYREESEE